MSEETKTTQSSDNEPKKDPKKAQTDSHAGCLAVIGLIVSVIYLANLSAGFIEIPDNLPVIGNLDEVFFSGVLFTSLAQLGFEIPLLESAITGRKKRSGEVIDADNSGD